MIFRRIGIVLSVIVLPICLVLLLNLTAPNPTHRRYSSRMPASGPQFTTNEIGLDGEVVLAADLHLPRNDAFDQRHCICNPSFAENRSGFATPVSPSRKMWVTTAFRTSSDQLSSPRLSSPDSKNTAQLSRSADDFYQIQDYAAVATELGILLWVFVRVDSRIDPEYATFAQQTGGGVVYYFTVPGYVDPVDAVAAVGAGISGLFLLGVEMSSWAARRQWRLPAWPTRPTSGKPRNRKVKRAADATENLDSFQERSKSRARHIIDVEDSRDEHP